jgi:TRAP-type mannitol/chloroaromatic compound transport system permease small subunit
VLKSFILVFSITLSLQGLSELIKQASILFGGEAKQEKQ